jgi:hypothetical protein
MAPMARSAVQGAGSAAAGVGRLASAAQRGRNWRGAPAIGAALSSAPMLVVAAQKTRSAAAAAAPSPQQPRPAPAAAASQHGRSPRAHLRPQLQARQPRQRGAHVGGPPRIRVIGGARCAPARRTRWPRAAAPLRPPMNPPPPRRSRRAALPEGPGHLALSPGDHPGPRPRPRSATLPCRRSRMRSPAGRPSASTSTARCEWRPARSRATDRRCAARLAPEPSPRCPAAAARMSPSTKSRRSWAWASRSRR